MQTTGRFEVEDFAIQIPCPRRTLSLKRRKAGAVWANVQRRRANTEISMLRRCREMLLLCQLFAGTHHHKDHSGQQKSQHAEHENNAP